MSRPRTGDKRAVQQPLKIDRLVAAYPQVQEMILHLRNGLGKTWLEIEQLSALRYDKALSIEGEAGFVDWDSLPTDLLELFPDLRLPHTNLHRWYDLRVQQVSKETMQRAAQARAIAEAFATSVVEHADEAVVNAARDQLMAVLAEDGSLKGRMAAGKALIALAEIMQIARANDIKERKVAVEEKKIKALLRREELLRQKLEAEAEKLKKKASKGKVTPEDLGRLTERTFGFRPKPEGEAAHG